MINESDLIRTEPNETCSLCGAKGQLLYQGLLDRLYGSGGTWNLRQCTDSGCKLIWLDPVPLKEDLYKAYKNYYTHGDDYPGSDSWTRTFYRTMKEEFIKYRYGPRSRQGSIVTLAASHLAYLHPVLRADMKYIVSKLQLRTRGELLEIGCGGGALLKTFASIGWNVVGVDRDPRAIENARRKGLDVRQGEIEEQKFANGRFDGVVLVHVIEHVHKPAELLEECARILKPGGIIVIATPNASSLGHRLYKAAWLPLDPPRHIHVFNADALQTLLGKTGFDIMEVSETIRGAHLIFMASQSIRESSCYDSTRHVPGKRKAWGRLMQLAEWTLNAIRPGIAEEIIVVAQKQAAKY